MGHSFKTKLSWTPKGYDKTLTTDLSLSVGDLPTEIRVTKLPNKMDYKVGETFNPDGIIVHAYYEDGSDYGTVLNSELSYDPMKIGPNDGNARYDKDGVHIAVLTMVPFDASGLLYPYYDEKPYSPSLVHPQGGYIVAPELINGNSYYVTVYGGYTYIKPTSTQQWTTNSGTYWVNPDGYTATRFLFRVINGWKDTEPIVDTSLVSENDSFFDLDNETINKGLTRGLSVTVIWHRPSDGATLTCPLTLNVEPSPDPPGPVVPEKVVGGDDVAIPAQAHSGDKTITGANYPEAQSVGDDAFNGCTNLETTNIPNAGVIGLRAFADCEKLTNITDGSLSATT